ncbi:heme utilization cystosolic carrier protein HutX [Breoghania sp.]|uniref:heme utilization cystosolic carrier protein HutX n=1 Tax=Breoghania sp. TaxID=2065378 RepID=UPI002618EC20|nr:heme utilization cystosolic carrier protein HutX [Breoghania sp.]MDJ0931844.1 heme utilization cystosolic carrier protein HutX [Breoghania sp.]
MTDLTSPKHAEISRRLDEEPGAVLEYVAKEMGVSPADVIRCLPADQATSVAGDLLETVTNNVAEWGEITFIVNTEDVIFEAKGSLPHGSKARGFFNLHGDPIGGHLKDENCGMIAFVSRPLFTTQTKCLQFFNKSSNCMFKIYLGRDEERQMHASQVTAFDALRDRLAAGVAKE